MPVVDLKAGRVVAEPPVFVEGEEGEIGGSRLRERSLRRRSRFARMSWSASVLTLFPDMFPGPLGLSLAGDALKRGLWSLAAHDIREHGLGPASRRRRYPGGRRGRAW